MKPSEAAALLTYASAFDNRNVTAEAAQAWADALRPETNLADGKQAIREHYSRSREWIMPVDVNQEIVRIRSNRLRYAPRPATPELETSEDESDWRLIYETHIVNGEAPETALQLADKAFDYERTGEEGKPADPEVVKRIIASMKLKTIEGGGDDAA